MSKQDNNPPQYTLSIDDDTAHAWTDYKRIAQIVASSYARSDNPKVLKWAEKIQFCSSHIAFAYEPTEKEQYKKSVASVNLCRIRTCPICQWRRSQKLTAQIGNKLSEVISGRPDLSAWMLTLTVKNGDVSGLKESIRAMLKAWTKLTKRKIFMPVTHWTRAVEVTQGKRNIKGDTHPHLHCILVTNTDELPENWVNNSKWSAEWRNLLKLDYDPQVDIRPIQQTGGAIREVLKYSVKPDANTAISGWLEKVALAIDGIRMLGVSKSLNDIDDDIGEVQGEYRLVDKLPAGIPHMKETAIIIYRWANHATQYHRQQVHWMSLEDYKEGLYIQNCLANGVRPKQRPKKKLQGISNRPPFDSVFGG